MKVILKISFLSFSNVDIKFVEWPKKLTWRSYTITRILLITSKIELTNKKKVIIIPLDKNLETFIIHISVLEIITIHFS